MHFADPERLDGARRRKIGLAGPGGSGAKDDLRFPERLAVFRLARRLRANRLAAVDFERPRLRHVFSLRNFVDSAAHVVGRKGRSVAVDPSLELLQQSGAAPRRFRFLRPDQKQPVFFVDGHARAERLANRAQMLVARSENAL